MDKHRTRFSDTKRLDVLGIKIMMGRVSQSWIRHIVVAHGIGLPFVGCLLCGQHFFMITLFRFHKNPGKEIFLPPWADEALRILYQLRCPWSWRECRWPPVRSLFQERQLASLFCNKMSAAPSQGRKLLPTEIASLTLSMFPSHPPPTSFKQNNDKNW